jgi:O-antigen/teichoic acid export membrane protein
MAQRLAWLAAEQADSLVVARLLGPSSLGVFSIAKNLSTMPLDRIGEVVNQVSLPAFSRVSHDATRWTAGFERLIRVSSTLAFPLFWGAAATAPVALPLVLGPKWDQAVLPFVLLSLPLPLRTNHSLATTALFAWGRADVSFLTVLAWAIVLVPAVLIGAPWGLVGVSFACAITFPLTYVISAALISRSLNIQFALILRPCIVPAVAATVCGIIVYGIGHFGCTRLLASLVLALQILLGVAVYILVFRLLDRHRFREVADLMRSFATP